jgi:hypothetical protein
MTDAALVSDPTGSDPVGSDTNDSNG